MKRAALVIISIFLFSAILHGDLEVNRDELKKAKDVEFINYTGPYDTVNTFEEIRNIGVALGKNYRLESHRASYFGRFSLIHVYDPADQSGKFDADIFVIEAGSFIDHVRNIRTVLAGYLQTAYGYTLEDALLIARFITLYNAVYRLNVEYFKTIYKAKVMENVSASDAGLALVFREWPGKTKALIPLSESFEKGKLSSLDTQQLTTDEVKDALRKEEDKGLEDRKKIIELQEKQLEEKEKDLQDDKRALEEEKKRLEEEKKSGETDATARKDEEIRKKEEEIARREDRLDASEDKWRTDREEIAGEERGLSKETSSTLPTAAGNGLFLTVRAGAENEEGEVVLFSFRDGRVLARSQGLRVKERRLEIFNNRPLVAAEIDGKTGAYLVLLNENTLAVDVQSREEVHKNTVLKAQGNSLYAVIKRGGQYFLGSFDASLALTYQSTEEVNPLTPVTVFGSYIYAQAKSGLILRLSAQDLSTKDTAAVR